jgi:hypothetical protein
VSAQVAQDLRAAAEVLREWRPIPGFPGYDVSNLGHVVSHRRWREPRLLAGMMGSRDYWVYTLSRDGHGPVTRPVHVLVAAAFLGPRPEGTQVRHLDGDPLNNAVENLAYGTPGENIADQVRHGGHHFANRTHCPVGHPYDEENTYVFGDGRRRCRTCRRRQQTARRAAAGAAERGAP